MSVFKGSDEETQETTVTNITENHLHIYLSEIDESDTNRTTAPIIDITKTSEAIFKEPPLDV